MRNLVYIAAFANNLPLDRFAQVIEGFDALQVTSRREVGQPLPLAWRWWVATVRLKRRLNKQWRRQLRRLMREVRSLARQALRHLRGRVRR